MDTRAKQLIERGEFLFGKKGVINSLHQTIAEHFYPERASFTYARFEGDEFADHMMTSYPSMVRRDLANQIAGMLRREDWFDMGVRGDDHDVGSESKQWLDWAVKRMRGFMYDRKSGFVRATKEGDHDFVTFGQNAISVQWNPAYGGMLYQCYHLKDLAWAEDYMGELSEVHRKCKWTLSDCYRYFGAKRLHQNMTQHWPAKPNMEFNIRHVVVPTEQYNEGKDGDGNVINEAFVCVWIDLDNQHVIQEVPFPDVMYNIPRWQTVSGSAYAHSPATIVGLPDARLIQDMTRVLLEAGETAVNPPLVATKNAVRGEISMYAGGVTYVDVDYDERLGEALRPLTRDTSGIPLGLEMAQDIRGMLMEGFYLNKLSLPPLQNMTAYEVSQRMEEWIRQALPIFEPMESSYNGGLCEMTMQRLLRANQLGAADDIPVDLQSKEIEFRFKSPLQTALNRKDSDRYMEMQQFLAAAAQADPLATEELDLSTAFRDALEGLNIPSKWIVGEDEAKQKRQAREMQAMAQMAAESGALEGMAPEQA